LFNLIFVTNEWILCRLENRSFEGEEKRRTNEVKSIVETSDPLLFMTADFPFQLETPHHFQRRTHAKRKKSELE